MLHKFKGVQVSYCVQFLDRFQEVYFKYVSSVVKEMVRCIYHGEEVSFLRTYIQWLQPDPGTTHSEVEHSITQLLLYNVPSGDQIVIEIDEYTIKQQPYINHTRVCFGFPYFFRKSKPRLIINSLPACVGSL